MIGQIANDIGLQWVEWMRRIHDDLRCVGKELGHACGEVYSGRALEAIGGVWVG